MKKQIKAFFTKNPGSKIKSIDLAKKLDLGEYEYSSMKSMLFDLVEEDYLRKSGKRYSLNTQTEGMLTGTLNITEGGYGFVVLKNNESSRDIFIASRNLGTAFNGDLVEVSLYAKQRGKNLEGQVVNILKRKNDEIVGELCKTDSFYFVKPDEKEFHRDIYITEKNLNGAAVGDKVVIGDIDWKSEHLNPEGKVKEILGKSGAYDTEIAALAREFKLPFVFPKAVLKDAKKIPQVIPEEEIEKRLDLRNKIIVTIDPDDAKDFDDAVSIEKLDNGNFEIGIHIADVSYYVEANSHLDAEALNRGNSVYFVGKVIPMLPETLSNRICSLVPGEDRLTYSVIAELTSSGTVENYEIKKSIINSKRRFTYDDAQKVISSGSGDFVNELNQLNELAKVLRKKRISRGSINFITPEVVFRLDANGTPIDIEKKEVKESHMLIEEYMLLANQIVAKHIGGGKKKENPPFVYRIHDIPDQEKIIEFGNFVKSLGYSFDPHSNKTRQLQKLLDKVKGTEEEAVINEVAIRSMAKAIYSTNNIGHYGLGFKHYTHFTSPIRRYSDLIVHRLLYKYIENGNNINYNISELEEISEHVSVTERNAVSAERLSVKLKQIEYMSNHIGEEFHGVISGVTHFGIFVELTKTLSEGLIRLRDMADDYYIHDEKNYCLVGRSTKKRYRLGDKVVVKIIRVDVEKRGIDFIIVENNY